MSRALIIHQGGGQVQPGVEWFADGAEVLRATPLLRILADHEVTWFTSESAAPLLWGNPLVERVLTPSSTGRGALVRERFDLVVNLESTPGCCALADSIRARRYAGYAWDARTGRARLRRTRTLGRPLLGRTYQDWLFALLDRRWSGETYVLGYQPRGQVHVDVGLNHLVTPYARERAWPHAAWVALRQHLGPAAVSMPVATKSPLDLADWVNRCRTVITCDSLGLHLALALSKRVVALFGPTDPAQVPLYGLGVAVTPPSGSRAMADIEPAVVVAALEAAQRLRMAG